VRQTPTQIDYGLPSRARWYRCRWFRLSVASLVLLLAASVLVGATFKQIQSEVDAVTGSMRWTTTWITGARSSGSRVSPLERRLKTSGIRWTPDWRTLHVTGYNFLNRPRSYACSSAPPIYTIEGVLTEFERASTDDELRAFIHLLQSGTNAQQETAIEAAADKVVKAMEQQSP
jgi:hypothetical protein